MGRGRTCEVGARGRHARRQLRAHALRPLTRSSPPPPPPPPPQHRKPRLYAHHTLRSRPLLDESPIADLSCSSTRRRAPETDLKQTLTDLDGEEVRSRNIDPGEGGQEKEVVEGQSPRLEDAGSAGGVVVGRSGLAAPLKRGARARV